METKEYISSGILELYVSGSLSPEETRAVDAMASLHPEIAEELTEIQTALENYISLHERNPRPQLRIKILEAISHASNPEEKVPVMRAIDSVKSGIPENTIPATSKSILTYLLAACMALLVVSSASTYFYWNKYKQAQNEIAVLNSKNDKLAQDFNLVKNTQSKTLSDLNILRDHTYNQIELQGMKPAPYASAFIYWNQDNKEAFIDVKKLPEPSADKQYQLWALVDGKPFDAGVFNASNIDGLQVMKQIEKADAWAVTLEPKGGSVSPTLEEMYLLSKS